jgi:hypothetical protein
MSTASEIVGLCTGHENPDIWFADSTDQVGSGQPRRDVTMKRLTDTLEALSICNVCPVKALCLVEGMKDENIDNGIWGGTLSGERIQRSRTDIRAYYRKNRIAFARRVRELQKV